MLGWGKGHTGDVMPNQYRAPEIIVRIEWTSKIDVWSVGLIVRIPMLLPFRCVLKHADLRSI